MQQAPYRFVPLWTRGNRIVGVAKVDAADYDWLNSHRWYMTPKGYAGRGERLGEGVRQFKMAREIVGLTHGDDRIADHINGNRLDNRRSNLRIVTAAENAQNIRRPVGRSGYRGVKKNTQGWMATVRGIHLGTFPTPEEAYAVALAYRRDHMPFATT